MSGRKGEFLLMMFCEGKNGTRRRGGEFAFPSPGRWIFVR